MKTGLLTALISTCYAAHGKVEDGYCHSYDHSCNTATQTYSFGDDGTHDGNSNYGASGRPTDWRKLTRG